MARNTAVGLNVGSPTSGDKSLICWTESLRAVGKCRGLLRIDRVPKWNQAVCLTMSGEGSSKADAMARSGASKYAVAPGDVHAHVAAWDKATDLAHFLSEAGLYICSSGEWPSVSMCADADGEHELAPVPRPRRQVTFHEIEWAVDRWRCTRCQRYARNRST